MSYTLSPLKEERDLIGVKNNITKIDTIKPFSVVIEIKILLNFTLQPTIFLFWKS